MKKKILIVDDDKDILEPLTLLLEFEGYDIETTLKGAEIYKKIEQFKPDLILLDILISGSDGRLICQNLKKQKETQAIPIIMMSAHPTAKLEASNSGANDFIAKPFEITSLFQTVKKHLSPD